LSQTQQRKFDLKHFRAITNAIVTYEDFNLLVKHLVEGMCMTFNIKGASIMLLDEIGHQLFRVSSYGISESYQEKGPVCADPKQSPFCTGLPEYVHNLKEDKRVQYPESAAKEGIVSMLSIPVKFRQVVIGVIRIYDDKPIDINEEDVESLCVMAAQLGMVIECNGLMNFVEHVKTSIESLPPRVRGHA
jgi:GAF domain-containing protein